MSFTKEQLKRASKLAEEGRMLPTSFTIGAMFSANWQTEHYEPSVKKKKRDLRKPSERK